jgi:nucleoid-associated protein YgaU
MAEDKDNKEEKKGFFDKLEEKLFSHEREREEAERKAEEEKQRAAESARLEEQRKAEAARQEERRKVEAARREEERKAQEVKDRQRQAAEDWKKSQEQKDQSQQQNAQTGPGPMSAHTPPHGSDQSTAVSAANKRTHKVQAGETLSHLALRYYGSAARDQWMRIYEANKQIIGDDPGRIYVGQELVIPD